MSTQSPIVLRTPDELNRNTLPAFKDRVQPHVDGESPGIVLDMESLQFVNSTGLGYIVHVGKQLAEQGRRLALARPTRPVEKLIRMIGLDQVLPLFRSIPEASRYVDANRR